jgi:hypothetical protein
LADVSVFDQSRECGLHSKSFVGVLMERWFVGGEKVALGESVGFTMGTALDRSHRTDIMVRMRAETILAFLYITISIHSYIKLVRFEQKSRSPESQTPWLGQVREDI